MTLEELGSKTAKDGFANERTIVKKFNHWETDTTAQQWLVIMNYNLTEIEYVQAYVLHGYKADVNVVVQIKLKKALDNQNIQVKLVSNPVGFNQVDKRFVNKYKEMWNIPENVFQLLKFFTGENPPYRKDIRDSKKRRMFMDELTQIEQNAILQWIEKNKLLILSDIIKGRGEFSAEWILVVKIIDDSIDWVLKNINEALNVFYGNGEVKISPRGSIKIGRITIQRKGGDAGRSTANMLQFKLNPCDLF